MTPKRFVSLFQLNPKVMVSREDYKSWFEIIKDFRDFDETEARKILKDVVGQVGNDKPRLYYVKAVWKQMRINNNNKQKRAPLATPLKELFNPELFK